jgi:hypothetical protein
MTIQFSIAEATRDDLIVGMAEGYILKVYYVGPLALTS